MSRRTQKNVGIIGLGIIGRRIADNLRRRGFHVFVWNRTPRPFPNFVGSPSEVAELCDFVQLFVSDDDALLQMVQQMKQALGPHHVVMAHSTVAPHTMRNAAEIVQRRGAQFLDAPFTGSKTAAEKGELVYYVAGDDAAYRRARPVLEASSKEIIEIGEIGQATTVKLATNIITAATIQAAAEAIALVHNSGLALDKFAAALRGNASNSATLSMKLPKMIEGDFDPHFSVKHMLKDVHIAARMARSYGLALGATEAARDSLVEEANSGRGDQDYSSLIHFFFPDGLPREQSPAGEEDDGQQTLSGVDEEAAAQARRDERAAEETEAERSEVEPADSTATPREEDADGEEELARSEADASETSGELAESVASAEEEQPRDDEAEVEQEEAQLSESSDEPASLIGDSEAEATEGGADLQDDEREAVADRPEDDRDDLIAQTGNDEDAVETEARAAESTRAGEPEGAEASGEASETELADVAIAGEPPRERRVNGESAAVPDAPEPSPVRDEAAARRSFLSRMFGKGSDY